MKISNQLSLTHRLATMLFVCATLFTAASCKDDEAQPTPIAAPTLSNASAITATGFTATWTAVTGAEKYLLDVSTVSTFATTVTGYNKKEITALTTNVTGLTANTKYYFRVYAKKGTTTSVASATKEATTTN
ncbi:MAG: fibronectin type III domain-containing protein [Cyclobacteriaceae bacterium]|jgi:hypothetical protein|nr:fibronectin type III domain-containing protein [Flammeovirgaceae bacterium]